MCAEGAPVKAEGAFKFGILDRLVEGDLLTAAIAFAKEVAAKPTRKTRERCIYMLVNAGARILEEGIALRAVDIDIIYLNGYGFPSYRGGPMCYADTVGLRKVCDRVREFQEQLGNWWEPAPLLQRLTEQGKTFAEFSSSQTAAA
jgi:3-hydroxyacyl-CoA dehydrogenase